MIKKEDKEENKPKLGLWNNQSTQKEYFLHLIIIMIYNEKNFDIFIIRFSKIIFYFIKPRF